MRVTRLILALFLLLLLFGLTLSNPPQQAHSIGNSITSPDTAGDVGQFPSIALDASGNPVVSYWDATNGNLKVLHCGDPNCTSGNSITSPHTAVSVGQYTSLVLDGNGHPVVSYLDATNDDLKVLHCGDPDCTSGNTIAAPDLDGGYYSSITLDGSGNPVIGYVALSAGQALKVLHCGNATCTSGNTIAGLDSPVTELSLALDASGNPVVSYFHNIGNELRVRHCSDPTCTSVTSFMVPDGPGSGRFSSLALDGSGNPVVSYWDHPPEDDLKVLHCGDPNCTSGNSVTSPDTAGDVGISTSLALDASGYPVVSYWDATNGNLKVLHCGDPNCTSGNSITSPDAGGDVGEFTSLALDASGNPVIAYWDTTNGDLKVLHCVDANCTGVVVDSDGDGQPDSVDACPNTPTTWLTPIGDDDCDGFTSADEGSIGTDPTDPCANTLAPNDEADDKWPPDFDDNRVINTTDVFQVLPPYFGTTVPPTSPRRDLAPNGVINTTDVFRVLPPFLGSSCVP